MQRPNVEDLKAGIRLIEANSKLTEPSKEIKRLIEWIDYLENKIADMKRAENEN